MWIFLCTGVRGTLGSGLQILDKSSLTQNKDTRALPLSGSCWSSKRLWTEVVIQREKLPWKKAKLKLVAFACTFAEELWDGAVIPSSHCHCSFVSLTFPAFKSGAVDARLLCGVHAQGKALFWFLMGRISRRTVNHAETERQRFFQMVGL